MRVTARGGERRRRQTDGLGLSGSALLAPRSRKHSSACRCDQISGEFSLLGLELEKEKDEEEVEEEVKMEMREGGLSCISLRVRERQFCSANLHNKITKH